MSRSRSPEKRPADEPMRGFQDRDRPEMDEQPAKRVRADTQKEDRARGKRLFGNILGTLQKFQKDDKTSRKSDAVKRREEIADKIQKKIRSETTLLHETVDAERELKALRIQTDSAEYVLRHKEAAMIARHKSLKPISNFLHTSLPVPAPFIFEGNLLNPSPIPLNRGPTREPPQPELLRPLYFLPKILLPHQQSVLDSRITNITNLIAEEAEKLASEKIDTAETVKRNRARIEELVPKLADLRSQVQSRPDKGGSGGGRDDFGRTPRGGMEVDGREDRREKVKAESVEREVKMEDERDTEEGVQIMGDDGDVEVEY